MSITLNFIRLKIELVWLGKLILKKIKVLMMFSCGLMDRFSLEGPGHLMRLLKLSKSSLNIESSNLKPPKLNMIRLFETKSLKGLELKVSKKLILNKKKRE